MGKWEKSMVKEQWCIVGFWWLVLILLIIATTHSQSTPPNTQPSSLNLPIQAGMGITGQVHQGTACSQVAAGLDCGSDPDASTASSMTISIPLGGATSGQFYVDTLIPLSSLTADEQTTFKASGQGCSYNTPTTGVDLTNIQLGDCMVVRNLLITATTTKAALRYGMTERGDFKVPHSYVPLHTNTFNLDTMRTNRDACKGRSVQIGPVGDPTDNLSWTRVTRISSELTSPVVQCTGKEVDGEGGCWDHIGPDDSIFTNQKQSGGASVMRNGWCSMCSLFTRDYMSGIDDLLGNFDDEDDDDVGNTPQETLDKDPGMYFYCDFDEWRDDEGTGFIDNYIDCGTETCHCNKDPFTGEILDRPDSEFRRYCGSACSDKFGEYINTNIPGRVWRGSMSFTGAINKRFRDGRGGDDDDENTGIDQSCKAECGTITAPDCDFYADCINPKGPLVDDDCDGDTAQCNKIPGPRRIYYYNPSIPGGCAPGIGLPPNYGGKWFSDFPEGMRPTKDSRGSYCSVDDEDCATTYGFDPTQPTYFAECPPCGCIPINDKHGPQAAQCPGLEFIDPHSCQDPFINYPDDDEDDVGKLLNNGGPTGYNYVNNQGYPICPLINRDRTGYIAMNQKEWNQEDGMPYDNGYGFTSTAEGVTGLGPMYSVHDVDDDPQPIYTVTLTIQDITLGNTADAPVLATLKLTDAGLGKSEAYSDDNSIYARLDDAELVDGRVGPRVGGVIVMGQVFTRPEDKHCDHNGLNCDEEKAAGIYKPIVSFDMGGVAQPGDPHYENNFANPWPEILKNRTNVFGVEAYSEDEEDWVLNSDRPGMVPHPDILRGLWGVPPGGWFLYENPTQALTYHQGCKGLGMPLDFFQFDGNAQQACNKERYGCVAGWPDGEDFLIQQLWFDNDMQYERGDETLYYMDGPSGNGGAYTKKNRDRDLKQRSPCVVSSRFIDMLKAKDPATFKQMDKEFGNMPPGCIPQGDGPPTCFLQGGAIIYNDPREGVSNIQGTAKAKVFVAIADVVSVAVSTNLAQGKIIKQTADQQQCSVQQNTFTGNLVVPIQNINSVLSGDYEIIAQCENGVEMVNSAIINGLAPLATAEGVIELSQAGPTGADFDSTDIPTAFCTIVLRSSTVPGVAFDTTTTNCDVIPANDRNQGNPGNPTGPIDLCKVYKIGCDDNARVKQIAIKDVRWAFAIVFYLTLAILVTVLACKRWNRTEDLSVENILLDE